MRYSNSLRTTILAATIAMLGMSAQAGPMPTHTATTMKLIIQKNTTEVIWGGRDYGYRNVGFHGDGWNYRGIWGHRGYGYSDKHCSPPLAARRTIKIQNRYLWTAPEDRLPWTD